MRYCSRCGSQLPKYNIGKECNVCAMRETFAIRIIVFLVFFLMADWGLFDLWITHNIISPIFKFIWAIISFVPKALGFIKDFFVGILGEKVFIGLFGATVLFYIIWKKAGEK